MLFYIIKRNMSQSNLAKLLKMAEIAEDRIVDLTKQASTILHGQYFYHHQIIYIILS